MLKSLLVRLLPLVQAQIGYYNCTQCVFIPVRLFILNSTNVSMNC